MKYRTSTSVVAAIGLVALMAAQVASGAIYYVSPDGTGTGASWDDPAGFEAAYAAAGEAGGGELWLKKGFHILKDTVILRSGVVVRGGFAGTETSAEQADPDVNVTSISGDTDHDNKWRPNNTSTKANFISLYDGNGGYVPINPNKTDEFWSPGAGRDDLMPYTANDLSIGFTNATAAVISGLKFSGITFSGYRRSAFEITSGEVSDLVLTDCRFVAINTTACSGGPIVLAAAGSIALKNCLFKGNARCIYQSGGQLSFDNCIFEENYMFGASVGERNSIIAIGNKNAKMTFNGCTVARTRMSNTQSYPTALCVFVGAGKVYATNTVFASNKAYASAATGNSRGLICVNSGDSSFSAYGCQITNNLALQSSQAGSAAFQAASGSFCFEDCYFAHNVVTNFGSSPMTSLFSNTGASSQFGTGYFINCTIEKNAAVAKSSGRVSTIDTQCNYGRNFAFVNCTVADNIVEIADGATTEVAAELTDLQENTSPVHAFVNTVFKGRGIAGHPFAYLRPTVKIPETFISSAIYDYPAQVLSTANPVLCRNMPTNSEGCVSIPTSDARLSSRLYPGAFGVPQRGVTLDSPYRKTGLNYWKGVSDGWWYYDTVVVWTEACRTVHSGIVKYGSYMSQYVPDYTTSDAYHDAVGAVRKRDKVCLGPLNPVPGMCVLVK